MLKIQREQFDNSKQSNNTKGAVLYNMHSEQGGRGWGGVQGRVWGGVRGGGGGKAREGYGAGYGVGQGGAGEGGTGGGGTGDQIAMHCGIGTPPCPATPPPPPVNR